jgi:hypothetical protein
MVKPDYRRLHWIDSPERLVVTLVDITRALETMNALSNKASSFPMGWLAPFTPGRKETHSPWPQALVIFNPFGWRVYSWITVYLFLSRWGSRIARLGTCLIIVSQVPARCLCSA